MVSLSDVFVGVFVTLVILSIVGYVVSIYNRLVRVEERCENAWSDITVVLKQRRDALEKLVEVAKRTMEYEEDVLNEIVEARESARGARTPSEEAEADAMVRQALGNLQVRAEDHPELQATDNLTKLQVQTATLEEQIADRREYYNEAVTTYNTRIRQFPYILFAIPLRYRRRELFEASRSATADVDLGTLLADEPTAKTAD